MKSFVILLAVYQMCSAQNRTVAMSQEALRLVCTKDILLERLEMQRPMAFIKLNFSVFSFESSPEDPPVDMFLTQVDPLSRKKSFILYTFPNKERLGVDANGTLIVDSENSTTFNLLQPCKKSNDPYHVLCASRKRRHFIVSMISSATKGFPVESCKNSLTDLQMIWKSPIQEQRYLHVQELYSASPYLARAKCLSLNKTGNCSRNLV